MEKGTRKTVNHFFCFLAPFPVPFPLFPPFPPLPLPLPNITFVDSLVFCLMRFFLPPKPYFASLAFFFFFARCFCLLLIPLPLPLASFSSFPLPFPLLSRLFLSRMSSSSRSSPVLSFFLLSLQSEISSSVFFFS